MYPILEVTATAGIDKLGVQLPKSLLKCDCEASDTAFPSDALIVAKVTPGSWAAAEGVKPGFELVKVNDTWVDDMSATEFMQLLFTRPVSLRFQCYRSSEEHGSPSSAKSPSNAKRRVSTSDWYMDGDRDTDKACGMGRRLSDWYLDGQRRASTRTLITEMHKLESESSRQSEEETTIDVTPSPNRLSAALATAVEGDDIVALTMAIRHVEESGVIADSLDLARRRLAELSQRLRLRAAASLGSATREGQVGPLAAAIADAHAVGLTSDASEVMVIAIKRLEELTGAGWDAAEY